MFRVRASLIGRNKAIIRRGLANLTTLLKDTTPILGYKSHQYGTMEENRTALDMSIKAGCKLVVLHTPAVVAEDADANELYNVIEDMIAVEELNRADICITHRVSTLIDKGKFAEWLAQTSGRFGGFDGLMVTGASQEGLLTLLHYYKKVLKNAHGYSIQLPLQDPKFNLAEFLSAVKRQDLCDADAYLVPLHSASHARAVEVIQFLREQTKSQIIACDVNKGDLRRPLLLSPPVHAIGAATAAAIPVAEATDRLKTAMDRCMHLERKFMDLHAKSFPDLDVKQLCWAHVLAQHQKQIVWPEEWRYFLTHQIHPKLNKALQNIQGNKAGADWGAVYLPMANYMFNAFESLLEVKKQLLLADITQLLQRHLEIKITPADIPRTLGEVALSFGLDAALLSGCAVETNLPLQRYGKKKCVAVLDAIDAVVKSYQQT